MSSTATADQEATSTGSKFKNHLCVIDGSNMLHRAWAMGQPRQRADGLEVGATHLFGQMMMKLMRRMLGGTRPPSHIAIFFDPSRETTWRREVFAGYKADRPAMDQALADQIPLMKQMCAAMGVAHATAPTHEADDLIAAYVEDGAARGDFCSVISTDKDLMQLVRPGVMQFNTVQDRWFNERAVEEKFGVPPQLLGDLLALAGDKVDGIPGAPGIGAKSACALITQFGSVGAILRRSAEIERASWRRIIEDNRQMIRMSRTLVALDHAGAPRPLSHTALQAPDLDAAYRGLEAWRARALA